jgi:hypothetical protein
LTDLRPSPADTSLDENPINLRGLGTTFPSSFFREATMRKKPTSQDARLIQQLHRLREEPELRRALLWWHDDFRPQSAGDYLSIEMAHGTRESRWLRQVVTYWGMAASLVLDGTLSERGFRAKFSDEMFAVFSKVQPFLNQLRKQTNNPDFMLNMEKVIRKSKMGRRT